MKYTKKIARTEGQNGTTIKKTIKFIDKTEFVYIFEPFENDFEETFLIYEPDGICNEVEKEYFQDLLSKKIEA
jgi:hypothetical protein